MYQYHAKVVKVIDGDTLDAVIDLGFFIKIELRIRLSGVDTEELRGGTKESKLRAQEAKKFVSDAVLGKDIILRTYKLDIYGRWAGDVSYLAEDGDMVDLVQELRAHGFEKLK